MKAKEIDNMKCKFENLSPSSRFRVNHETSHTEYIKLPKTYIKIDPQDQYRDQSPFNAIQLGQVNLSYIPQETIVIPL